jgi:hypothetical protein
MTHHVVALPLRPGMRVCPANASAPFEVQSLIPMKASVATPTGATAVSIAVVLRYLAKKTQRLPGAG